MLNDRSKMKEHCIKGIKSMRDLHSQALFQLKRGVLVSTCV